MKPIMTIKQDDNIVNFSVYIKEDIKTDNKY